MSGSKPKTLKAKVTAFLKASPGRRFKVREVAEGITKLYPEDFEKNATGSLTRGCF